MNRVFTKKKELESKSLGREQKKVILKEALSTGVSWYLGSPRIYSNLYIVSDHGSWRKELIEREGEKNIYKGNRSLDSSLDWSLVWETFNEFLSGCREKGIECPNAPMIEGDDWVCGLTQRLNEAGECCVVLSTDQDLTQLVRPGSAWTAWLNNRGDLRLHIKLLKEDPLKEAAIAGLGFWEQNSLFGGNDVALETLKNSAHKISYINPEEVVIKKVLAGDKSDNIRPVLEKEHNGKISHFTEKEASELMNSLELWRISGLTERLDEIYEYIRGKRRWSDTELDALKSRINYNINLVLLDNKLIPEVYKNQFSLIISNIDIPNQNSMKQQSQIINSIIEDRMFLSGTENLLFKGLFVKAPDFTNNF